MSSISSQSSVSSRLSSDGPISIKILPATGSQNLINGAIGFNTVSIEGIISITIPSNSSDFKIKSISFVLFGQEVVSPLISSTAAWSAKKSRSIILNARNADIATDLIRLSRYSSTEMTEEGELDLDITPTPARIDMFLEENQTGGRQIYQEDLEVDFDDSQSFTSSISAFSVASTETSLAESFGSHESDLHFNENDHFFLFHSQMIYQSNNLDFLTLKPNLETEYQFTILNIPIDAPGTFHSAFGSIEYHMVVMVERDCHIAENESITYHHDEEIAVPRFHPLSVFQPASERIVSNSDSFTYFSPSANNVTGFKYDLVIPATIQSLFGNGIDVLVHLSHVENGNVKGLKASILQITEVKYNNINSVKSKKKRKNYSKKGIRVKMRVDILGVLNDVQEVNGEYWKKMITVPIQFPRKARPSTHIPTETNLTFSSRPSSPNSQERHQSSWESCTTSPLSTPRQSIDNTSNNFVHQFETPNSNHGYESNQINTKEPYIPHIIVRHELRIELVIDGISGVSQVLNSLQLSPSGSKNVSGVSLTSAFNSVRDKLSGKKSAPTVEKIKGILSGRTTVPIASVPLVFHGLSDEAREFISGYVKDPEDKISIACLKQITYRIRR